jgi:hypothetical protein
VNEPAGLSAREWRYCRRLAFSPWHQAGWMGDLMMLLILGAAVWLVVATGIDRDSALWGGTGGMALGALLARNLPIRSERVVARLTRALEPPDQA